MDQERRSDSLGENNLPLPGAHIAPPNAQNRSDSSDNEPWERIVPRPDQSVPPGQATYTHTPYQQPYQQQQSQPYQQPQQPPQPQQPQPAAQAPKKKSAAKKSQGSQSGKKNAKSATLRSNSNKGDSTDRSRASFTTASPTSDKRGKKQPVNLDVPRSARPAHRVIPYVLLILAAFIGACLLLNLFCNPGNQLEDTPGAHWMGSVGYYFCYWLFGLFGPAVFVLPLLLINLALYWKRYIDNRLTISKIVASLLFMILLAAVIHVFCLSIWEEGTRKLTSNQLIELGSQMTMGGLIGGGVGYFLVSYFNIVGSIIVGIFLLAAALFYFLGMTPHHLWSYLRTRRSAKREGRGTVSEKDAQAAGYEAKMQEKMKRTAAKRDDDLLDIPDENGIPMGAVTPKNARGASNAQPRTPEEIAREKERKKEERMAPIPIPVLDPNEGKLFVPTDINRRMAEEEASAGSAASTPVTPTSTAKATPTAQSAQPARPAQPAQSAQAAQSAQPTVKPINPAANRDTAIDPIFPQADRPNRHVPRADRNFDLKTVFIEDINDIGKDAPKQFTPVPPEVPMPGSRPASARPQSAAAPKAVPAKPAAAPKPATGLGGTEFPSGTVTVKQKPSAAAAQRPVVRKVSELNQKDFGLSSEEFEKLEAQRRPLPKSMQSKPAPAQGAAAKPATKPVEKPAQKPAPKPRRYVFPPITYLHAPEPMTAENREEIEASVTNLSTTLQNFRININSIAYSCGPTVTRYELTPAAGVRVRSIVNLADDISLAFASKVRIEAPIPGKSAVGIEVPNKNRSNVFLRELIESKQFAESQSKLTSCLGADVTGKPLFFDIAKMPHLLVAGATGMGKSVCINSIIMSLLYKAKPDEVKLVLIDPKKVEFGIYKGIPHLLAPIVTAPKDAAGALQAAVEEMENRFELIQQVGVHDIKGYNKATENDPDMPFMPQIVIIIDELADLMMTAPDEVETAICRLAQKARAAGMHIIIGTQRPSVDVVTGLIKSNIPSRIAFTVASQVDSRTILDVAGAEKLIGRGDMLFAPVGAMGFTRVQGAFVDEKEVENICEFIRVTNGTASYDERFTSKMKELSAQCGKKGKGSDADLGSLPEGGGKGDDAKYSDAVRIAVEEKRVATSLLQRKLEIGYSRAAKLIDRMQAEGIVSAPDGSKPRTVLITPEEYIARFIEGQPNEEG